MSNLALLEKRAADAVSAFENFVTPFVKDGVPFGQEQSRYKTHLKTEADQAAKALNEARQQEQRFASAATEREQRHAAAERYLTGVDAGASMSVTNEPTVYGPESDYSWVVDRVFAERNGHARQAAARQRLDEHGRQIGGLLAAGGDEARKIERYIRLENRNQPRDDVQRKLAQVRQDALEQRTGITTGSGSGGAWVVPVWLLDRTVYYNLPSRPFLNALDPIALPPSGMTINVPAQTGPAAVSVHSTQNSAITETDVTSSTVPLAVQPIFGGQTISVEQLERESWGGSYDMLIMRSLQQAYDQQCDTIALTAALAASTSQTYSGTFALTVASGSGGFYGQVAAAMTTVETAAGILAQPNAMFLTPGRWGKIVAQADASSRPLIVPTAQGPNNAVSTAGMGAPQGLIGQMLGLDVYKDLSIPTIGTSPVTDQAIVLDTTKVLALEAAPTFETFPATLANQASVYMRLHGYLAVGGLQQGAVVSINGSAMS